MPSKTLRFGSRLIIRKEKWLFSTDALRPSALLTKKKCPKLGTKRHLLVRFQFWIARSVGFRIYCLYLLLRGGEDPLTHKEKDERPEYNTKLYLMVRLTFWKSKECGVPLSLPLLPGPLWLAAVVVPVKIPSMSLFKNHLCSIWPCAKNILKKQLHKRCI